MFELRQELLHPAVSHFPVVLILLSFFSYFLHLIFIKKPVLAEKFKLYCLVNLYLAVPSYFLTLFLGEMAFDLIKNDLCEIASAYRHEEMAELGLVLLIITIAVEVLSRLNIKNIQPFHKLLQLLFGIMLILNALNIARTSHSGGQLVYEQGAAVKNYHCPD